MKRALTAFFIFSFVVLRGQEIFDYEKKIDHKEDYIFQEIEFKNTLDDLTLFGTLITPKITFDKLVIIIPGSGIDSRYSHYKLTQELLQNDVAVFRYDERGVGKSEGDNAAFRYGVSDITRDIITALQVLQQRSDLQDKKFGLIGHSQGGMVSMGVLQQKAKVDFLVQWATPVQKHGEFFKYQIKTGLNTFDSQLKYDDIDKKIEIISVAQKITQENLEDDNITLSKKINKEAKKHGHKRKHYDRFQFWTFSSIKDILRQNYEPTYQNTQIPIIYIIGSEDIFVDPKANTELLKSFSNPMIEIEIMEGLNHYLTKKVVELQTLQMDVAFYDIDKKALDRIIEFIKEK